MLVRADGRRHVLFSKGENVVHVPVGACDGVVRAAQVDEKVCGMQ